METPTVVDALALLFVGLLSGVVALIVAVSVMVEPLLALGGTLNVNWNAADAPAASVAMVQMTGPVPLQLNAGPAVCDTETNVVPAGTVSVSVTLAASEGPLFITVTV